MNLVLHRLPLTTDGIFGRLYHKGKLICHTLEPVDLEIPVGTYRVNYLPVSASGKYKDVYHVTNVTNRTGILIHKGNTQKDSIGCILVGDRLGELSGIRAVLGSAAALTKLHSVVQRKSFLLTITRPFTC